MLHLSTNPSLTGGDPYFQTLSEGNICTFTCKIHVCVLCVCVRACVQVEAALTRQMMPVAVPQSITGDPRSIADNLPSLHVSRPLMATSSPSPSPPVAGTEERGSPI